MTEKRVAAIHPREKISKSEIKKNTKRQKYKKSGETHRNYSTRGKKLKQSIA